MIRRIVEPELLDSLPPNDPRAIHSRRDLRLINRWMGNARHIGRAIVSLPQPPRRVLELGTGDGSLMLKLAPYLPGGIELSLLDMQPVIAVETIKRLENLGWSVQVVAARIEDWVQGSATGTYDLVLANLFLHHFEAPALRSLFAALSDRTRAFISCDPRRWWPALVTTRFLWVLGCNGVTRNDARISVRAGFRDRELSGLWPANSGFALSEGPAGFASHRFMARR
jgi:hypothetical protein